MIVQSDAVSDHSSSERRLQRLLDQPLVQFAKVGFLFAVLDARWLAAEYGGDQIILTQINLNR